MANLYIVATPIGNLSDITLRALEVLKSVDFILAEDTRQTKKLLDHYQIKKPLISYHQHSRLQKIDYIVNLLKQGKNLALVSEAGTPGISDPGNKLIKLLITNYQLPITIIPVPGPCALVTAASISGFPTDKFVFLGFPPSKRKREKFFKEVAKAKETVILYESVHRILRTLEDIKFAFIRAQIRADSRGVVVCRELTKKFETTYRGTIKEVTNQVKNSPIKGEYVIIINKNPKS